MTTDINVREVSKIEVQRRVFTHWNGLRIWAYNNEGNCVFELSLMGEGYTQDHKPVEMIWKAPHDARTEEEREGTPENFLEQFQNHFADEETEPSESEPTEVELDEQIPF